MAGHVIYFFHQKMNQFTLSNIRILIWTTISLQFSLGLHIDFTLLTTQFLVFKRRNCTIYF